MTKGLLFSFGYVYYPKTKCSGKLCLHKKTLQSLGRSVYQSPQCASVCQVRKIPFEDQKKIFFLVAWARGSDFWRQVFEQSPKSFSRCFWRCELSWQVLFQRKEMRIFWLFLTTPWSIYGCGKCAAWLFVHKVRFMLQEHVKTTKTDKTCFFFVKKRWTWYPTNNC